MMAGCVFVLPPSLPPSLPLALPSIFAGTGNDTELLLQMREKRNSLKTGGVTQDHIKQVEGSEDARALHGKLNLKAKSEEKNENIAKRLSVELGAQLCIPVSFSRDGASELSDKDSKNVTVNFLHGILGATPKLLVSGNRAPSATK
jgi:hypothetical protein